MKKLLKQIIKERFIFVYDKHTNEFEAWRPFDMICSIHYNNDPYYNPPFINKQNK